jgi:hypothetical protein
MFGLQQGNEKQKEEKKEEREDSLISGSLACQAK